MGAIPALAGVAVGVAVVRRTGAARAAILVGMPTMWALSALHEPPRTRTLDPTTLEPRGGDP